MLEIDCGCHFADVHLVLEYGHWLLTDSSPRPFLRNLLVEFLRRVVSDLEMLNWPGHARTINRLTNVYFPGESLILNCDAFVQSLWRRDLSFVLNTVDAIADSILCDDSL